VTLVDTSVWVEVFRKDKPLDLEKFLPLSDAVTCLPVVQEVLQGFRDELPYRRAREMMWSLSIVESPMHDQVFLEAAELFRVARRSGLTVRSSVDCLIAACAIRNHLEVLHIDRDFVELARVTHLRERRAR
jgi:predicted nucleic acid-binding protein